MTAREQWKQVQAILGTAQDGIPGPNDEAALRELKAKALLNHHLTSPSPPPASFAVDARSEKIIATLHPTVQPYMRVLVRRAEAAGIQIRLTSGTRTYAEQDALYAQGRTAPGKKVTNARGGYSSHNFGIAADFTIFDGNAPVWESPDYAKVGRIAEDIGLSWGGRWSSPDEPHVYLKPPRVSGLRETEMIAALRERKAAGKDVFS